MSSELSRHLGLYAAIVPLWICIHGCSIEERADFMIGRECDKNDPKSCDPGQRCLPHVYNGEMMDDFRCRDRASFEPIGSREAPLAYCDTAAGVICPGDLVCNADRVRLDAGFRRLVCKRPDDLFAPPLDGGT